MPASKTPKPAAAAASSVDITDLLAPPPLDPIDVTLLGETYTLRRDWTGAEVARFWVLMNEATEASSTAATEMLLGADGIARLNKQLTPLPDGSNVIVMAKLMKIAGLVQRDPTPVGESPAS